MELKLVEVNTFVSRSSGYRIDTRFHFNRLLSYRSKPVGGLLPSFTVSIHVVLHRFLRLGSGASRSVQTSNRRGRYYSGVDGSVVLFYVCYVGGWVLALVKLKLPLPEHEGNQVGSITSDYGRQWRVWVGSSHFTSASLSFRS